MNSNSLYFPNLQPEKKSWWNSVTRAKIPQVGLITSTDFTFKIPPRGRLLEEKSPDSTTRYICRDTPNDDDHFSVQPHISHCSAHTKLRTDSVIHLFYSGRISATPISGSLPLPEIEQNFNFDNHSLPSSSSSSCELGSSMMKLVSDFVRFWHIQEDVESDIFIPPWCSQTMAPCLPIFFFFALAVKRKTSKAKPVRRWVPLPNTLTQL